VIELDSQTLWIYGLRGIAYASLQKYEQAIEDFNRALDLSPQSIWARDLRDEAARLLKLHGQNDQDSHLFAQNFVPQSN
jgi:tetratricopeptide (TPR) repeat protein